MIMIPGTTPTSIYYEFDEQFVAHYDEALIEESGST